ncbi:hypothetical protein CDCA_CDCA14G3814 [Cyanidium caldarium]|uniref:J domain-containing protein n=1 Tax=Cyanidium caldarium TaxID=2771 RepID=A0AAV9IZR1_CYACA|nr:hypothetical protein CDCA_CDCA14G3814 [Cyanidium caldarium]
MKPRPQEHGSAGSEDHRAVSSAALSSEGAPAPRPRPTPLLLGSFIIFGAYLAGVIGFKYSRFAVGKDIHRGWENYRRFSHERLEREAQSRAAWEAAARQRAFVGAETERLRQQAAADWAAWARRWRGRESEDAQSLYAVLGVSRNATAEEIRRAYLRRAKVLHPDVVHVHGASTDHVESFRRLVEAYQVLRDPAKRRAYDAQRWTPSDARPQG